MIKEHKQFNNSTTSEFRSGFVAIVGAPNVGKSTLMNRVLDRKISITSRKPQTTRNRILGILTEPSSQFALIDTPGIHKSTNVFNNRIVDTAFAAIMDVDLILFVTDILDLDLTLERALINKIKLSKKPVILAINKIDKIKKPNLLKIIKTWSKTNQFKAIVPVCALTGYQIKMLISVIRDNLPEGPRMFPQDTITDASEEFIVSEIIREKIFRLTGQEIPYSVAVTIDSFEKKTGSTHIYATVHVERNSQKGIIIGKSGTKLGQISEKSKLEIQKLVGNKVFIKLFIRTQKNWSSDTKALKRFGY